MIPSDLFTLSRFKIEESALRADPLEGILIESGRVVGRGCKNNDQKVLINSERERASECVSE